MANKIEKTEAEKTVGDKPVETKVEAAPVLDKAPKSESAVKAAPVKKPAPPKAEKPAAKKPAAKKAAPKKVKTIAAKAKKPVAAKEQKETTMTNMDMKNWFGGYDLPNADKVEELMAKAGKQGEELLAKSRHAGEEMVELTRANIEAMVEAGRIAATGAKDLGTELIEEGRASFEKASDNVRLMAEAKNPTDLVTLQSEIFRAQFDAMVSESAKLTERMVKLAGDAAQPVANRASLNVEKAKELMA